MRSADIVVLVPWFGPWPFWLPAYLASCAANPGVRWELFGDHPIDTPLPSNVALEQLSFADYCEQVSARLGIRFAPAAPYKLCDLKPALGEVHADRLGGARFWAFSDIDLVYGDLLGHFGPLLERWDIISTHHTRISGHFALLRNTPQVRGAFRQARNWRAALETPEHTCFDESGYSQRLLPHKKWPRLLRNLVYLHDPLVRRSRFVEEFTTPMRGGRHPWLLGRDTFPQRWCWQHGRVANDLTGARQFPYFHFLDWKRGWSGRPRDAVWHFGDADPSAGFQITEQGFAPLSPPPSTSPE